MTPFPSTVAVLCLLAISFTGCAMTPKARPIAIEDFCSDPRIIAEAQKQDPKLQKSPPWCEASRIAFRRDGEVTDIAVASVLRGYGFSYDVGYEVTDSIIRLPEDRLVNLGRVAPVPIRRDAAVLQLLKDLQLDEDGRSAAILGRFYKPFLELTKRGYCLTYEMLPPFSGRISQCAGSYALFGNATYMPGATTWAQARADACNLIQDIPWNCGIADQRLLADETGKAVYLIELTHFLPEGSEALNERFYFFVDIATGVATLRGHRLSNQPKIELEQLLKSPAP